jgi:hypothetical protein
MPNWLKRGLTLVAGTALVLVGRSYGLEPLAALGMLVIGWGTPHPADKPKLPNGAPTPPPKGK